MIRSFRSKALKRFAESGDGSKLSVQNIDRLKIMIGQMDAAAIPEELNLPGFYFHPLRGKDKGRFSIRVTGNYRLTFAWDGEDAIGVDLEDYH